MKKKILLVLCTVLCGSSLALLYKQFTKAQFKSLPVEATLSTLSALAELPIEPPKENPKCVYPPPRKMGGPEEQRYGLFPQQFTIRHIQGNENGITLQTNYSTIALLLATDYYPGHLLQMLDLRAHRFDSNQYGCNVGIGGRYIPESIPESSFCQILGMNVYYDYNQAWLGYFQQIGVGLEVLGKSWDFRANAYIPIGPVKRCKTCVYDDYTGYYYAVNEKLEEVSYSFNGEVGCLAVDYCDTWLFYLAGGPYYIAGRKCVTNTVGGEFRIRPQYRDYIAIDAAVRYDSLFKWIYQLEFVFNIPLYQIRGQNKRPCSLSDRQIYQPVQRFEVLPISGQSCWKTNW